MTSVDDPPLPTLQRLVDMFRGAMRELQKTPDELELERWAVLIHASMSGRGRSYHTVGHVFDVAGESDGVGTLAVLFHDTVYCEVDGGLPRGLDVHLSDALQLKGGHGELDAFDPTEDEPRALTARLFGLEPGEAVALKSGLNELASALLAVRALRAHLSLRELAELVTCIEATIPFRPHTAEEVLYGRLEQADTVHGLGLGSEGVERAVHRAVRVANRDIGNFAYEDTGAFLSHTWEILPEANPTLRAPAYTLGEYRTAMARMESFLANLDPTRVFRRFRGRPSEAELAALEAIARTNLHRGRRYLRQKLLSARLLETLARETGGDAPVSLLMGDLPQERASVRLEHLLPPASEAPASDVDPEVQRLLTHGRGRESYFDMRHSPVAAYLYARLGDTASDQVIEAANGPALLAALPQPLLREVALACARIAPTRAAALQALVA